MPLMVRLCAIVELLFSRRCLPSEVFSLFNLLPLFFFRAKIPCGTEHILASSCLLSYPSQTLGFNTLLRFTKTTLELYLVLWKHNQYSSRCPEHPSEGLTTTAHPIWSHCTPEEADFSLLGDFIPTVVGILCYFPRHTKWRQIAFRIRNNAWTGNQVAMYILFSRGITAPGVLTASTISKQFTAAWDWTEKTYGTIGAQADFGSPGATALVEYKPSLVQSSTIGVGRQQRPNGDVRLIDLAEGLQHLPKKEDATVLTAAITMAIRTSDQTRLSGFQSYVQRTPELAAIAAIQATLTQQDHEARDEDAAQRHNPSRHTEMVSFFGSLESPYERK
ncbi:hypothetical protein M011DRAFT_290365 [Sporormia fimetaria CBS 119925]|uniref:Uncharacterized protein n=1 Tax=Sporormia fimetaria CBS 119925 TaxID=1340428 RepID=A0A6A6UXT4_9PLEO|nr:hypothetical protein M011DRAFT_290365 [Sporormia fimetaria CBS 119925]